MPDLGGGLCSKFDTYFRDSDILRCQEDGWSPDNLNIGCVEDCERGFPDWLWNTCEGGCPATHVKCEGVNRTLCFEKTFWGEETDEDMCTTYMLDLLEDGIKLGVSIPSVNVVHFVDMATGGVTRLVFDICDHWYDGQ